MHIIEKIDFLREFGKTRGYRHAINDCVETIEVKGGRLLIQRTECVVLVEVGGS